MKKTIIFLILALPMAIFAQKAISWDFPVRPGTLEWNNLNSYQERLNAYNIPQSILKTITTKELIKACLNYPEYRLVFTRNDLQLGFNYISTKFNGFKELESRNDAGKVLLELYSEYDPEGFDQNSSDLEIGRYIVRFTYIELLMAQHGILKNFTDTEINELTHQCVNKYNAKKKQQAYYGIVGLKTTALILARKHKEYLEETLQLFKGNDFSLFINKLVVTDPELMDKLVAQCSK